MLRQASSPLCTLVRGEMASKNLFSSDILAISLTRLKEARVLILKTEYREKAIFWSIGMVLVFTAFLAACQNNMVDSFGFANPTFAPSSRFRTHTLFGGTSPLWHSVPVLCGRELTLSPGCRSEMNGIFQPTRHPTLVTGVGSEVGMWPKWVPERQFQNLLFLVG